jgi:hypothetical protein
LAVFATLSALNLQKQESEYKTPGRLAATLRKSEDFLFDEMVKKTSTSLAIVHISYGK